MPQFGPWRETRTQTHQLWRPIPNQSARQTRPLCGHNPSPAQGIRLAYQTNLAHTQNPEDAAALLAALDCLRCAITIFDGAGRLVHANAHLNYLFRSLPPHQTLLGKSYEELIRLEIDGGEIAAVRAGGRRRGASSPSACASWRRTTLRRWMCRCPISRVVEIKARRDAERPHGAAVDRRHRRPHPVGAAEGSGGAVGGSLRLLRCQRPADPGQRALCPSVRRQEPGRTDRQDLPRDRRPGRQVRPHRAGRDAGTLAGAPPEKPSRRRRRRDHPHQHRRGLSGARPRHAPMAGG